MGAAGAGRAEVNGVTHVQFLQVAQVVPEGSEAHGGDRVVAWEAGEAKHAEHGHSLTFEKPRTQLSAPSDIATMSILTYTENCLSFWRTAIDLS
jgi:hypothetical protein